MSLLRRILPRLFEAEDEHARGREFASMIRGEPTVGEDVETLRHTVRRLDLVTRSLTELLVNRLGINPQELDFAVARAELTDSPGDLRCTACGQPADPKRKICVFCEAPAS